MRKTKEKTNQYINDTELKSLIIRINNKAFIDYLRNPFLRLHKYAKKYNSTSNESFKEILKKYILRLLTSILKNEKNQLLLIPDKKMKTLLLRFASGDLEKSLKKFQYIIDVAIARLELLKNTRKNDSNRLKKYIDKHTKSKSQKHKRILRDAIIHISERNIIDKKSYERFGECVLLIIKNILKKPKFSGYTYRDEFYSDSTNKILRYLKNFDHKKMSKITGQQVSAFSYLSQYVHNSILFIIETRNAEKAEIEKFINTHNESIKIQQNESTVEVIETVSHLEIKEIKVSLYDDIIELTSNVLNNNINVVYPNEYRISIDEYNKLTKIKDLLGKQISVIRKRK